MARRSPKKQSEHDRKVRQSANRLKREGWEVQADLPGHDQPDPIGKDKRIPDIVATKAGAKRIVEVETAESMETDKKQQETFRRSAAQQKRTRFCWAALHCEWLS